ncbi:hypothetical protein UFOVP733_35 [uncultured Caudovirales phage]|uniref:Uncharacterized protein n=1 Tax=uncultured Caudovirales phage TaxID=2100421 RepID=A0A6J5P128_9CAUD|nr:hypothetical protein UFOVP733_35 [uncultured Caudovirales phage]CAB5224881.1 hypothetical protein UFOVP743_24 [uncultured Caudovirales phage]
MKFSDIKFKTYPCECRLAKISKNIIVYEEDNGKFCIERKYYCDEDDDTYTEHTYHNKKSLLAVLNNFIKKEPQ